MSGDGGFVGRRQELDVLHALVDDARRASAACAVVCGETGIGKSALVAQLAASLGPDVALAEAWCSPVDGGTLDVIDQLVAQLDDPPEREVDGAGARPPWTAASATEALAAGATAERPLLVVVEDLQWADAASVELLDAIARRCRNRPLGLVFTVRVPSATAAADSRRLLVELTRIPGMRVVELGGLTAEELAPILAQETDGELDPDLVASIQARARGNPLFARHLARAADHGDDATPGYLEHLLAHALEGVPTAVRQVVGIVALAGGSVRHDLLAAVADDEGIDLASALDDARRAGLVVSAPADAVLRVHHPLLADAVVDATPAADAARLHDALARHLEADPALAIGLPAAQIAHHRYRSGPDRAAAVAAALAAADEATSIGAHDAALQHLEAAVERWPDDDSAPGQLATVLARAAMAAEIVGRNRHAVTLARRAVSCDPAADRHELGERYLVLLEVLRRGHHPAHEVDAALARAEELLADGPPIAEVRLGVAHCWSWDTDPEGSARAGHRAIERAEALGAVPLQCQALVQTGGALVMLGERDDGLAMARRGQQLAMETGFDVGVVTASVPIAAMLRYAGEPSAGADEALAGLARLHDIGGGSTLLASLNGWAATALSLAGRWDEAEDLATAADGDGRYATLLPVTVAQLLALRGRRDEAAEILARTDELGGTPDPHRAAAQAWLAWLGGDPDRTVRIATEALAGPTTNPAVHHELAFLALLADPRDGDVQTSPVGASAAVHPGEVEARWWVASADAAASGDADDWLRVHDGWCSLGGWPHMQVIAAARHADAGGRDAGAPLLAALRTAQRLDAAPLEDLVRAAAGRAAIDLPPAPHDPTQHLTPRESEVLDQLAHGHSNRRIAGNLDISEGTVSVHISNLMRKLGVASRTEAAVLAVTRSASR